jgi:hypothetical protein
MQKRTDGLLIMGCSVPRKHWLFSYVITGPYGEGIWSLQVVADRYALAEIVEMGTSHGDEQCSPVDVVRVLGRVVHKSFP